jgi:hypothetical protein
MACEDFFGALEITRPIARPEQGRASPWGIGEMALENHDVILKSGIETQSTEFGDQEKREQGN